MLIAVLVLSACLGCCAAVRRFQHNEQQCGPVIRNDTSGVITSPHYPNNYPTDISCTWIIITQPRTTLTIEPGVIDIEEDSGCSNPPCCKYSWISVPPQDGNGSNRQYCGSGVYIPKITVKYQQETYIKFHASRTTKGGRGFHLYYNVVDECGVGKTRCPDGRCVVLMFENRVASCRLETCENPDDLLCGSVAQVCYNLSQKCNGIKDCPNGEDEDNCLDSSTCMPDQEQCSDGRGCFSTHEHCDGVQNCQDNSDEKNCICTLFQRKCNNQRCISEKLLCNGIDDCGDNSDEQGCLKNSIITGVIMGSLICGLLVVIAIGCMCRLYSLRVALSNYRMPREEGGYMSGYPRMIMPYPDEIFHREPPPTYAIAVSDCQPLQGVVPQPNPGTCPSFTERNPPNRHCRRFSRRHHMNSRRISQRHQNIRVSTPTSETTLVRPAVAGFKVEGNDIEVHNPSLPFSSTSPSVISTCISPDRENNLPSHSRNSFESSGDDVQLLIP